MAEALSASSSAPSASRSSTSSMSAGIHSSVASDCLGKMCIRDRACREGDEVAWAAVETMTDYLARGLQIISAVVDPEVYVLGGGASASADVYLDKLREKYAACALSVSTKTPIEVAELGNDAGIIGAAYVALRAAACEV